MKLSAEAALQQAVQVGSFILIPLVSMFGWNATPAYYNIISDAIDWAHNGGIRGEQLDEWALLQNKVITKRHDTYARKSMTYVDDTAGAASESTVHRDMQEIECIIVQLMGPSAANQEKTLGPETCLPIIGWQCDMMSGTMQPSTTGIKKMLWWLFRGVQLDELGV